MKKHFTMMELIIVIAILAILASIVLPNIKNVKSAAIASQVQNNIRVLQTAVDMYALDNNDQFPTVIKPTVDTPQLIDVSILYPNYIKTNLDSDKYKNQKYWLDYTGKVWGSTANAPSNIMQNDSYLEWNKEGNVQGYNLYKKENSKVTSTVFLYKLSKLKEITMSASENKIQIPADKSLLISSVDEYGLETAPFGINYKGASDFKPIFNKEGKYYFEVNSDETLYWDAFVANDHIPEGTSINYRFAVSKDNGTTGAVNSGVDYEEFNPDFSSLPPRSNIKVEMEIKGANGKIPAIYNVRVYYHYAKDEAFVIKPEIKEKKNVDNRGQIIEPSQPAQIVSQIQLKNDETIDQIIFPDNVDNSKITYQYSNGGSPFVTETNKNNIPAGSAVRIIRDIEPIEPIVTIPVKSTPQQTKKEIQDEIQTLQEEGFSEFILEHSNDGFTFIPIDDLNKVDFSSGTIRIIAKKPIEETQTVAPIVKTTNKPVTIKKETLEPNTTTPPVTETPKPEWTEVNKLRFLAQTGDGNITHWISVEAEDTQPEGTRILYSYSTSNNSSWNTSTDDVSKLQDSRYLQITASLQVKTVLLGQVEEPSVTSVRVTNSKGVTDLNTVKPIVLIKPTKSNNQSQAEFSTETKVTWNYEAFDPKGKQIIEVKWSGDKQEQYTTPGTYTVKLQVRNATNYWSDEATYTFTVKDEKPVAVIYPNQAFVVKGKEVAWASNSYDPDNDGIQKVEWRGDKKEVYNELGDYSIGLRVQDNEGNWSDWVEFTFKVIEESHVRRLHMGTNHSAILLANGTVKVWGSNTNNVLGISGAGTTYTPTVIPNLYGVKELYVDGSANFALMEDGTVKAWGKGPFATSTVPTTIPGLSNVKKLAVSTTRAFALTNDGFVYVWGSNSGYSLGIGNGSTGYTTNTPVKITSLSNVKDVYLKGDSSYAVLENGNVYQWGAIYTNSISYSQTPVQTAGVSNVKELAVGSNDTLALLTNGDVYGWGYNSYGQLGAGSSASFDSPKKITALSNVKTLYNAGYTSFAINGDGKAYGWGQNYSGNSGVNRESKVPLAIPNSDGLKSFANSTEQYAGAGILSTGKPLVWGSNSNGAFGMGTTNNSYTTPTVNNSLSNIVEIGMSSRIGMYLNESGDVYIAGNGSYDAALGLGSGVSYQYTPKLLLNINNP